MVLGAAHPVGTYLCRRLAGQDAFVVAADTDETRLQGLAQQNPSRIAPLSLKMADTDTLARLAGHWAEEALHLLVLAHPLHAALPLGTALTSVASVTRAFAPTLAAAEGAAVLLFPAVSGAGTAATGANAAALARLTQELAQEGARLNALALHPPALRPEMADRVCITAMMMALPMARSVAGAVMPVGRARA